MPLLEAMAADVPVFAYASTAVPETLGGAGVLFAPKDLEFAAELLGQLAFDDDRARAGDRRQRQRLEDFADDRLVRASGSCGRRRERKGWRLRLEADGPPCWRGQAPFCSQTGSSRRSLQPPSAVEAHL